MNQCDLCEELGKNTMPEQPKTERLGVKTGETCTDVINRQEAIETAENVAYAVDEHESAEGWLAMLINSLEILPPVQPEERTIKRTETHACDLISRQAAINGLDKLRPRMIDTYERNGDCFLKVRACDVNDMLQSLPSAQPEPCEDAISRQAAIDIFDDYNVSVENGELEAYGRDRKRLCELPSAQPDRSLWFRIGEICVDESKGFISAGRAVEKIRELLRETGRWEE